MEQVGLPNVVTTPTLKRIKDAVTAINTIVLLAQPQDTTISSKRQHLRKIRELYKKQYNRSIDFPQLRDTVSR
jgi:hypothetical protein